MTQRSMRTLIRMELERHRRLYEAAVRLHSEAPNAPDRRERWYGAVRALEQLSEQVH